LPPRGPGGGSDSAVRSRRLVALAALIVVLILIVIGVHSCQVSQANSDLRDYSVSVNSIMQSSQQTSQRFFALLSSGQGSTGAGSLETQLDEAHISAAGQLSRAQGLSVPGQLQTAQQELVLALRMRAQGIFNTAQTIPSALQSQTASLATSSIAAEMARFYASDVLYKDYVLPMLVKTLTQAGIAVGGPSGEPVNQGQFLPNVQWLTPSYVATQLRAPATPSGKTGATSTSYTVKPGDTLSGIAAKTGVPLATLESLNPGINPSALQTGQHLKLR
jgi:LysM repeat protein